jgi:hypothetical protein
MILGQFRMAIKLSSIFSAVQTLSFFTDELKWTKKRDDFFPFALFVLDYALKESKILKLFASRFDALTSPRAVKINVSPSPLVSVVPRYDKAHSHNNSDDSSAVLSLNTMPTRENELFGLIR